MAELKSKKDGDKVSKRSKKDASSKMDKKTTLNSAKAFSLLADDAAVDSQLSSLFAVKIPVVPARVETPARGNAPVEEDVVEDESGLESGIDDLEDVEQESEFPQPLPVRKRKRKQRDADEDLEGAYMDRLVREEERDARSKRPKREVAAEVEGEADDAEEVHLIATASDDMYLASDNEASSPPPKHETQTESADVEREKANRTVFLGNVSTDAISSKSARKTLTKHLTSFFENIAKPEKDTKHKLESIRFRSTPYATKIPKKAAFARKELMDETTRSTNAYAVYSSPMLAREAAKRLNGSTVLHRHLRVDEIAHPSQTDHRRCIFVGNLGFVDDESNIQQANEDDGRETRKRGKEPADIEEGLWRTFMKCGTVESVRVIRDSTTRVGKGIAYVQFEDANAVEAALLYDGKKFPPMLPRKLRVSRAKAIKRNAKPGSTKPTTGRTSNSGYQRKISGEEASRLGRASKLYGRAAAAKVGKPTRPGRREAGVNATSKPLGNGIKKPEDFVFEGHRASSKNKPALKIGGGKKGKGKPTNRSAKRGAAYKAGKKGK